MTTKRAKRYRAYLERQQDLAAARVGAEADKHYAISLNGFGTTLTADQARMLRRAPGVLSVVKDTPRTLTDNKNPIDFLRLSGRTGVWSTLGGQGKAGKGVVVGVIDSGIWPESASFAGRPLSRTSSTAVGQPYLNGSAITMKKSDGDDLQRGLPARGEGRRRLRAGGLQHQDRQRPLLRHSNTYGDQGNDNISPPPYCSSLYGARADDQQ